MYNSNSQSYFYTTSSTLSNESSAYQSGTSFTPQPLPSTVESEPGSQHVSTQPQQPDFTPWGSEISNEEASYIDPTYSNDGVVSVSTCFYPKSDPETDTVFVSSDSVFFYITHQNILNVAPNAFRPCLLAPLSDPRYRSNVIMLDAPSAELNIVFHALHKSSPASNSPTFEMLVRAIDHMPRYGLLAEKLITPDTPIYELLLSHAPLYPLDSYALAAHHGIGALASTVSTYLLSHDVMTVSDEIAERIGSIYLKRLLLLHSDRFNALKDILLRTPIPHPETPDCSFQDQRKVTRAWALVSAYLVWDVRPDISSYKLSKALNPVLDHVTCKHCENTLKSKIKDVLVRWTAVKRTI